MDAADKPTQNVDRIGVAGRECRERCERESRFAEREKWRLILKPSVPADCSAPSLLGPQFDQQCDVVERFEQVDDAYLAHRHLGAHQVAPLDSAPELRARVPLRCHEHMFY